MTVAGAAELRLGDCFKAVRVAALRLAKKRFRRRQYVVETFTWLPEMPEPILIDQDTAPMAALGRVNHADNAA